MANLTDKEKEVKKLFDKYKKGSIPFNEAYAELLLFFDSEKKVSNLNDDYRNDDDNNDDGFGSMLPGILNRDF